MITDCTALILAGGSSTRMGRDKTLLEFEGQTLLQRVIDEMQGIFPEVLVSVRHLRPDVAVTQICDEMHDAGPLAGVCAGLAQAKTPWVFAIAADMPFVDPAMVRCLAQWRSQGKAVVPVVQGFPQPLSAFYAKETLVVFEEALAGVGSRSLRSVLERLDVCRVDENHLLRSDPSLRSFIDLDTPEDFARVVNGRAGQ